MEVKLMASTADADVQPPTIGSTTTTSGTATAGPLAEPGAAGSAITAKTLKRCLSVPIIHSMPGTSASAVAAPTMTTRSAAKLHANNASAPKVAENNQCTPKKYTTTHAPDSSTSSIHIGIPRSNPSSREVSPAPVFNIFGPRTRRYSASYSPLGTAANAAAAMGVGGAPLCMTPRVTQLRQEECVDMNSREVNHEREVHSAMQMSQSWEDLTLVAENWSCKSDEFSNPLQVVVMPSGVASCSSPSPTNNRCGAGLRLPYGLSPSPTRRTFATRRSMSPIAMRPSQLGPVKRKFELDDNSSNWNVYSPPPLKKIFTDSRGSSPVCQSPSSVCPSPDSGNFDGRITPKLFISKLCTTNTTSTNSSSACSSPMSSSPSSTTTTGAVDGSTIASSSSCYSSASSSSGSSSICGGSEPMSITNSIDEGILVSESGEEKPISNRIRNAMAAVAAAGVAVVHPMSTSDMNDESTLMDDMKSETSSIGGCSSFSVDSYCSDSVKVAPATTSSTFFNKLTGEADSSMVTPFGQKNFIMNKSAKKFIVNHDNLPHSSNSCSSSSGETADSSSIKVAKRPTGGPADTTAMATADGDADAVIEDKM